MVTLFDVPNLDCFSDDPADLDAAADTLRLLGSYAASRAISLRYRKLGNIEFALIHEREQERIYKRLPQWARW